MAKTTLDTLDELLEGAFDDVDDPDVRYKLRSARQLVQVIQQRHDTLDEAINDALDDEEMMGRLRDLGYITSLASSHHYTDSQLVSYPIERVLLNSPCAYCCL